MIGLFDSGIGGLSILRQVRKLLPAQPLLYLADQDHVPYGAKPIARIRQWSSEITRFLLEQGAELIVVACNTASAAALENLRQSYPTVPFVGMEPAVGPAAQVTRSGKVGVLATPGTFGSDRYARLMRRFAQDIVVFQDPCHGLVELIESGQKDAPATKQYLQALLAPMLETGIDTLVLGCTHYPFVADHVQRIAGPTVTIIDPAPAVARQVKRLVNKHEVRSRSPHRSSQLYTTGDPVEFRHQLSVLSEPETPIVRLRWQNDFLTL